MQECRKRRKPQIAQMTQIEEIPRYQDPAFLSEWALENGMEVLTPDRMTFSPPLAEWPPQIEAATPAPPPVAQEP